MKLKITLHEAFPWIQLWGIIDWLWCLTTYRIWFPRTSPSSPILGAVYPIVELRLPLFFCMDSVGLHITRYRLLYRWYCPYYLLFDIVSCSIWSMPPQWSIAFTPLLHFNTSVNVIAFSLSFPRRYCRCFVSRVFLVQVTPTPTQRGIALTQFPILFVANINAFPFSLSSPWLCACFFIDITSGILMKLYKDMHKQ